MTEEDRGPVAPPQDGGQNFIRRSRYSIYDSMASSAIERIKELGQIPLSSLRSDFWRLPQNLQDESRRCVAKIVFKAMNTAIDTALSVGCFHPEGFYTNCDIMFEDAGVQNPFSGPIEPYTEIPPEDLEKMREIHAKDPSNIRFLNKGLRNLPHSMRREFRRFGITLLIIQDELMPQVTKEMEALGIPRTYGKRKEKKVLVS